MPDPPAPRRQPAVIVGGQTTSEIGYVELRCKTNFSFLEGASHPDELVSRAAELGYVALAVTDRNSLAGVVRAHAAAKEGGMRLIVGAEIHPVDAPTIVLLPTDRAAYGRLCRLITAGRRRAPKGECVIRFDDICEFSEGLIGIVCPDDRLSIEDCRRYAGLLGDRGYLFVERHLLVGDDANFARAVDLSHKSGLPLVAGNDVHYHVRQRRFLHDVVTAIRHGCSVAELGRRAFPNAERHLKSPREMATLFASHPELLARTVEIVDRCRFSLDELRYEYPEELVPEGQTPREFLARLTWEGAHRRYPHGIPAKVRQLIEHELRLIAELKYEAYFLTVWDLVRYARSRDILCQGRGSAANSAVCYCLGVTSVDPDRIDVLFERFISKERNEAPDIDIDFEHERREEVIQYVYRKYGRERAGMTATLITYRIRSAVRDVGKALGLSLDRVDILAKSFGWVHEESKMEARFREAGLDPESLIARQLRSLVTEILGFPRHLSQHVSGMVMTRGPLCDLVPIENAAMADRTVIEWDKDDLDEIGILKVDCLCLGMLSAIRRGLRLVESLEAGGLADGFGSGGPSARGPTSIHDLFAAVPAEDPAVYGMIQRADTVGVFQIESRAQMSMLPRLKPACFYDLVIEVAIVRPGPIQGDMVHPYLRRRCGEEEVSYPNEEIRDVLAKTLGVPIFQEQAMRLAVVAAGFSPGEADQLRRAMGAWRRKGVLDKFYHKLVQGMLNRGYDKDFAERVFNQIRGFGEYGFPESHAASFALLVYVSCWLKYYHPAAFCAALLNSQPMGFYAPAQLVADARAHGVEVRPVDVNLSEWDCTLEPANSKGPQNSTSPQTCRRRDAHAGPRHRASRDSSPALRLGFRMVSGFRLSLAERIVQQRARRPFSSFDDFAIRTGLSNAELEKLAEADAFASLQQTRRESYWEALPAREEAPLFDSQEEAGQPARGSRPGHPESASLDMSSPSFLPLMSSRDEVVADYQTLGLSLKGHPMTFLRSQLNGLDVLCCRDLTTHERDRKVKVAGLVLLRQRPGTASGITFMTLEDETGQANIIVHPNTWERFHKAARKASILLVRGMLQREHGVIHVVVDHMEDLSDRLRSFTSQSRDFR